MSVGEKLREARVSRGLDIAGIAAQLKIQSRYLVAIEAGQRDQVPSAFLFRSWVRQYAAALGLDYAELQPEVEGMVATEAPLLLPGQERWIIHRKDDYSQLNGRSRTRRLVISLTALAVIAAAGSGAYVWWRGDLRDIQWPKLHIQAESVQANAKPSPPAKLDAPLAPIVATPAPSAAMSVEIFAREQTWVSITPDGKLAFSGVLKAHETRSIQAEHSALLKIGNAAGVEVRVNGNSLGEIGPEGRIRIVVISPDGTKILDSKGQARPAQPATV